MSNSTKVIHFKGKAITLDLIQGQLISLGTNSDRLHYSTGNGGISSKTYQSQELWLRKHGTDKDVRLFMGDIKRSLSALPGHNLTAVVAKHNGISRTLYVHNHNTDERYSSKSQLNLFNELKVLPFRGMSLLMIAIAGGGVWFGSEFMGLYRITTQFVWDLMPYTFGFLFAKFWWKMIQREKGERALINASNELMQDNGITL